MATAAVTILADQRERRSGLPAELARLGLDVDVLTLPVGDFVVPDRIVIVRKTIADLHRSIARGRLWRQIASQRDAFDERYLLVEGECLWHGPVLPDGIRGALLAVTASGVGVIHARDVGESAASFRSIAMRAIRANRPRHRRRQARADSSYALMRTLPGVTPAVAERLLAGFGSVAGIALASDAELRDVPGVGPATARTIKRFLSS